jgi:hypothetical protein
MPRWLQSPVRSSSSGSGHSTRVPGPVSGSVARTDRGQDEGADHQAARSHRASAGDRSDGNLETQPRARAAGQTRRNAPGRHLIGVSHRCFCPYPVAERGRQSPRASRLPPQGDARRPSAAVDQPRIGLSCRRLLRLVRDRSFSRCVLNGSGLRIFGYFGQLGGPDC